MDVTADADLLVVIGSRLQRYTKVAAFGKAFWPEKVKTIHVISDPLSVGRHIPVDLGIAADARKFLTALRPQLAAARQPDRSDWAARALAAKAAWDEERQKWTANKIIKGKYLAPAAIYEAMGKALPHAIYVGDVGSTTAWTFCMIKYGTPKGFIYTGSLAGLGFGMPGALGAKLGAPDKEVVGVLGDGAFSLSISSLITAVEHKIPVRILVCDNAAWGAEKGHQQHWYGKNYVGADLDTGDLVEISRAMRAKAVRCNSIEELVKELKDAPVDGPKVIVVPTDPDDFPEPTPHGGAPARSWAKNQTGASH
jgi:thiamine pyrophosphate-dependent acetolactate synthase large subunit-like protein